MDSSTAGCFFCSGSRVLGGGANGESGKFINKSTVVSEGDKGVGEEDSKGKPQCSTIALAKGKSLKGVELL